jgi:hypothetical protein
MPWWSWTTPTSNWPWNARSTGPLRHRAKCTASSRLIVCDGIHDRFVEALRLRMRQLKVGHALEAGVQIGPVADARQLEQNLAYLWPRPKAPP